MSYILMTPEGKKVRIDPRNDEELYGAPHNPPNTGTQYTSGTDLHRHVARSGNAYYYTYFWSMWEGTESFCELLSEQEAKEFLVNKAKGTGWKGLSASEIDRAEEIFPGIFEEDA